MANCIGTSVWEMLPWLIFGMHRFWKCCCGSCSGHIGFGHVVVANVSLASVGEMLLWPRFRRHWPEKCCRG